MKLQLRLPAQAAMKTYEIAPYFIEVGFGPGNYPSVISMEAWDELPDDLKAIFLEVQDDFWEYKWAVGEPEFNAANIFPGIVYILWSPEEMERGKEQGMPEMWKSWFDEMEEKGLPGDETFDTYVALLAEFAATQTPIYENPMVEMCGAEGGVYKDGVRSPLPE